MSKSYFAQPAKYFMAEPVKIGGQLAVRYLNLDGTERIRVGGMSAFRNNNPGNAGFTPYIKSLGAIGEDTEGRAIFPDCEIGDKAMQTLLRHGMYRNMSIRETLQNYAPPKGNPTEQYIKYVTESSGLSETSNINSMTDEEFKRFTDSMKQFEDSSPEGGFDLITFVPGDQKEWHRQDFIKISAGSSSKDFGNYGPNIFTKYGYNIPYETIPKKESIPAVKAGNATSGNAGGSPSPVRRQPAATHSSGGGGTLERRGDQVYRIEEDGKNRGSFYSP